MSNKKTIIVKSLDKQSLTKLVYKISKLVDDVSDFRTVADDSMRAQIKYHDDEIIADAFKSQAKENYAKALDAKMEILDYIYAIAEVVNRGNA